ncbi:ATP-binding cassette domain-containing protein [Alteromonas halophila]|uniref:Vitamin B12 import ATP-binding protein BtuD n=1 Tax=Alteromonas halophila TaxID=516698 RepID=A0A918JDH0_9ALTE|nr:ATP-binding cassette domain-containing protein [Alteromonas halophila]GGW75161.1 vitamin B12 import ATP-binding protein BtuD [Alteromonas halophila]
MKRVTATGVRVDDRLSPTDVTVKSGECIHVLGENGAGKSTLLLTLAGLLPPSSGSLMIDAAPAHSMPPAVFAAFRSFHTQHASDPFGISVREYLSFFSTAAVSTLLPGVINDVLDIGHLLGRRVSELSGGERQRVDIARTLLQVWPAIREGRALIFMDEPFSSLDIRHKYKLANYLTSLASAGNSCIVSSHELNLSANYSHRVWLMRQGQVVHQGAPEKVMTPETLGPVFHCDMRVEHARNMIEIHVIQPAAKQ